MQIQNPGQTRAADLEVGFVFTETVQLGGDLTPREHRFAVTAKRDSDSVPHAVEIMATTDGDREVHLGFDADEQVTVVAKPFKAGYVQADERVFRGSFRPSRSDGTATVTFEGTINVTDNLSVAAHSRGGGRINLYAEVAPTEDTLAEVVVAVVPTGKRIPQTGRHIGSVGGSHVYLLDIRSGDRAAYEAAKVAEGKAREARRMLAAAGAGLDF